MPSLARSLWLWNASLDLFNVDSFCGHPQRSPLSGTQGVGLFGFPLGFDVMLMKLYQQSIC